MTRTLQVRQLFVGLVGLMVTGSAASVAGAVDHNVLIIVADDFGVDVLDSYDEGSGEPPDEDPCTPNLDLLRSNGVLFRNAWSAPVCSPTRATIQTGRYALRTGVAKVVAWDGSNGLRYTETIIPEMLDASSPNADYSHAAIGKWHLTTKSQGADPPGNGYDGPNLSGYDDYAGLVGGPQSGGEAEDFLSYCDWKRTVNGSDPPHTTQYATTVNVTDALN